MAELLLGVNIDHIATLRNARGTAYPDPVQAAFIAEQAGADGITVHLREDRRHITDRDVRILRQTLDTRMNLEMADAENDAAQAKELERIAKAATYAASLGLKVNAGHGLTYHNVKAIAALPEMHELNIGHAIIGRAVMSGLKEAVSEMKRLMLEARQ